MDKSAHIPLRARLGHLIYQLLVDAKLTPGLASEKAGPDTGEQEAVQSWRPLHQDEVRVFDPSRLLNHPHYLQWQIEQSEMQPRYVDELTGPKSRKQLDGHMQQINPQFGVYQPPRCGRTTDGIQQVSGPQTPIPAAHKEAERVQALDPAKLPLWVQQLRDGSLLVPSQDSATGEQKDAMLMTLPGSTPSAGLPKIDIAGNVLASAHMGRRSQPLDVPDRSELPTTPSLNKLIEQVLPSFIGGGEMPAVDQEPFPEHSWVNSAAPILAPMREDLVAAQDRIAVSQLDDDDTLHVLRAVKITKESE